jgi:AraC-like DNA-binding protein
MEQNPSSTTIERVVATRDVDEANQLLANVYVPHRLRSRESALNFKMRYVRSARLTLGHLRMGADAEVQVPPMQSCYHVNLTLSGATDVVQGARQATTMRGGTGAMFVPKESRSVHWSPDAVQYAIKIPRGSLEGQLSALLGRPIERSIDFALGFDTSTPRGQSLLAAIAHLRSEVSRAGGLADSPLVRAQLESYVLSQLLLAVPHEHLDDLFQTDRLISRRYVQVALDFIHDHLGEPLTGPDIARAAAVSIRALQSAFHDEVGLSPMAYVRARRLERVHADLLASGGRALVQDVAATWGFYHFGRFAEQYRRKFGVLPSDTTRAGRAT